VRERLQRAGIPVVETWEFTNRPIDMVAGFSNREAGRAVAAYLLGKGYGTIGYLGTAEERSAKRLKGYLDESRRLGREAVYEQVDAPSTIHDGEQAFARLIARVPDLRAVFCSNDGMAIGALTQCRRMGLAVPARMAVVGFSDTAIAQAYVPPLTSVGHQRKEIGVCAGRMLLDRLRGRNDGSKAINLGFRIIERQSS
jgi:LacI family gluconate utilization system Gnt-I transcriptional repressor